MVELVMVWVGFGVCWLDCCQERGGIAAGGVIINIQVRQKTSAKRLVRIDYRGF